MAEPRRITETPAPGPPPAECVVGDTLCRVRVLSEAQWEALPEADRPTTAAYFPDLGWVIATPGRGPGAGNV
jgi:hypothetical protein